LRKLKQVSAVSVMPLMSTSLSTGAFFLVSLKDRISQPSASAPVTSTASTLPVKPNGRDLRSRISDAPSLAKLQTTSLVNDRREPTEPRTSSASPLVSRSPGRPP